MLGFFFYSVFFWFIRCLDLQRKNHKTTAVSGDGQTTKKARKSGGSSSCPAMNRNKIQMLSEDVLSEVQDIEQIVRAGRKSEACPYYATRASVGDAQVGLINCDVPYL